MRTTLAKAYGIKVRCYWVLFALTHSLPPQNKEPKKKLSMESPLSTQLNWEKNTPSLQTMNTVALAKFVASCQNQRTICPP
jgi:hypothetical protein